MAKYRYEDEYDDYEPPESSRFDNPGRRKKKAKRDSSYEDPQRNAGRDRYYEEDPRRGSYGEDPRRNRGYEEPRRNQRQNQRYSDSRRDPYGEDQRRNRGYEDPRRDPYYDNEPRRRKKRKRRHPVLKFILIVLLILVLLVVALAFRYYGLSNYVEDNSTSEDTVEGLPSNNGVYNILLIGVDRRDESWNGNSDSMILLSINSKQHAVYMISFMRDLGVDIPGIGTRKLNAACANGGPSLLVQTIEENFLVNIDNYACVDFASMIQIVDLAGGVELTVSADEAEVANGYILDMANTLGDDPSPHYFPSEGGTLTADGYQAVAYSRIRYVGNSDYQRTARQRTVLSGLMDKVRTMNPVALNSFITDVMPLVTHNIDSAQMAALLPRLALLAAYPVKQDRVPYDGYYYVDGEMLMPDLDVTRERLYDTIYGSGATYGNDA